MNSQQTEKSFTNAFTIDVEDYFQVAAFDKVIDRSTWNARQIRVESNVDRLLEMLNTHQTKATFFTLGWVAERFPSMVRRIVDQGHELASHGYGHQKVTDLTPEEFAEDIVKAKRILEDLAGIVVTGYRAPSFSIGSKNLWAHDVLSAHGHKYSSSVYPVKTDLYGMPEAPRTPWQTESGLWEIPPSTIRLGQKNFPGSGGGYFRLLPLFISKWGFTRTNSEGQPAIFYCHPWEIDPDQPRIPNAPLKSRFRHYVNLGKNFSKIENIVATRKWSRMDVVYRELIGT
jgi:polysaccharide deacetylase family protein (PEP-CTERM system associated)